MHFCLADRRNQSQHTHYPTKNSKTGLYSVSGKPAEICLNPCFGEEDSMWVLFGSQTIFTIVQELSFSIPLNKCCRKCFSPLNVRVKG
jgi:hypothetical protein